MNGKSSPPAGGVNLSGAPGPGAGALSPGGDALFHYRLPGRAGGQRPGAHAARTTGAGNEFTAHARLFDHPDPRRLDLRASLRAGRDEWLVRTYRQRAAVPVYGVVDVSASMAVGAPDTKLESAAAFVATMAASAFQSGDAAGLCAFDGTVRDDLYHAARHSRGAGLAMAETILGARPLPAPPDACGLVGALRQLAGREALVFLLSDFNWPLDVLETAFDLLSRAWVVPLVLWDAAEITPPAANGFARLRDAETGRVRALWVSAALRRHWLDKVAERRRALDRLFLARAVRPLYVSGAIAPETVSAYFFESLP